MPHPERYRLSTPLPVTGGRFAYDLAWLRQWGCHHVELALAEVAQLGEAGRQELKRSLDDAFIYVAAVVSGTPGRRSYGEGALEDAFELAVFLSAACVVSPAPASDDTDQWGRAEGQTWLAAAGALAEQASIRLLVENRPGSLADSGQRVDRLLSLVDSRWVGVALDPAKFVELREHPFLVSFKPRKLKQRVGLLRISDALFENGMPVPAGLGNAELKELVSALEVRGYRGFYSISSPAPGAGPEQIAQAFAAFGTLVSSLAVSSSLATSAPGGQRDE